MKGKTKSFKVMGCNRELFSGVTLYVSKLILAEWPQMMGKTIRVFRQV